MPRSVRRADRVLTVSERTKRDLIERYGLPEAKIVVTPNGVDPAFTREGPARNGSPYALFVGAIQPRKDPLTALRALARSDGDLRLVMAGPHKRGGRAVREEIRRLGLERRVELPGYVSKHELASLYRGAACLVFPSRDEGFGLPVVEAMACGTPVVATATGAIPEVAGDAAILVEPGDPAAVAEGIVRALAERDRLVAAGLERARLFTWAETARRTLERLPGAPVSVAAVVVTHGPEPGLDRCIRSLLPQVDELVVVANLPRTTPPLPDGVSLIENRRPQGFAANANLGIRATTAPLVVVANPDIEAEANAVPTLRDFLTSRPRCGIAGPGLLYPDGRLQPSRRRFPTVSGTLVRRIAAQSRSEPVGEPALPLPPRRTLTARAVDSVLRADSGAPRRKWSSSTTRRLTAASSLLNARSAAHATGQFLACFARAEQSRSPWPSEGSSAMAVVVTVVASIPLDIYEAVTAKVMPDGQLPEGCSVHIAGPLEGNWHVITVWDSAEQFHRFREQKLLPAIREAGGSADEIPHKRRVGSSARHVSNDGVRRQADAYPSRMRRTPRCDSTACRRRAHLPKGALTAEIVDSAG